jgi:hypothetical protein
MSYTTELVRVRWESYPWSQHYDRSRREGEANSHQHIDDPISLEELQRQKAPPLGIWSGWPCIPPSFSDERCTSLRYQGKACSSLHWSVSYHWQVWAIVLLSGAAVETIRSSQYVSCFPTQKISEAFDWCSDWRYYSSRARLDIQGLSH